MTAAVMIVGGLILLMAGGESLVRGAVGLARSSGVSPTIIGLTVVACGTSAPELVVCVNAALDGFPGIAVGNIVGSNIANLMLIVGAAAVIYPMACKRSELFRDGAMLVFGTTIFVVLCLGGRLERTIGGLMILLLVVYTVGSWWLSQRRRSKDALPWDEIEKGTSRPGRAVLFTALGILGVILGAEILVGGSVDLARVLGVSEAAIGLTVVAFGTSLPELATAVAAAAKRRSEIAFGNIVGSNIFNLLGIMGVTAAVTPIAIPDEVMATDLWVMSAVTVGVLFAMYTGRQVSRGEGAFLLAAYACYFGLLLSGVTLRLVG